MLILANCITMALVDPICDMSVSQIESDRRRYQELYANPEQCAAKTAGALLVSSVVMLKGLNESSGLEGVCWDCSSYDSTQAYLNIFEWGFGVAFTVEMLLKIVGKGFIFHPNSYLRDSWNWVDFGVVVSCLMCLRAHFFLSFGL